MISLPAPSVIDLTNRAVRSSLDTTSTLPSRVTTESRIMASPSLIKMSPAEVTSALIRLARVLRVIPLAASARISLAMNIEAVPVSMKAACTSITPLAEMMPFLRVKVPPVRMVISSAGSNPFRPPMKPVTVKPLVISM